MERREFLCRTGKTALAVAGSTFLSGLLSGCPSNGGKPWNIVFVLADDLGWNQVGYHGFDFYETPAIDRIASEGMHFTDAYAAAPVCSPTRASIMTGKSPARLHLTCHLAGKPYPYARLRTPDYAKMLPLQEVTLPEMLKKKGYATGHFGKWHLNTDKEYAPGRPGDPGSQGFDEVFTSHKPSEWTADDGHHAVEITDHALRFIQDHKDGPFFCYVSHHVVHRPLMEEEELIARYRSKPGSDLPVHNPIMGAMIERMDDGIGRILDLLDKLELAENTIVIFVSDNGGLETLQDQDPLRGGKAMLFEGGIKVPMAVRWPGVVQPGTVSRVPVITHDFFPTLMEAVGIGYASRSIDGESLMPLLSRKGDLKRDAIFWHYPHYHHMGYQPASAVRMGDYKLIEWHEATLLNRDEQINLFNVREDPGETRDLVKAIPEKAEELRGRLRDWLRTVGAQEMIVNPDYDPERADWKLTGSKEDPD
jgi:arylsulfatase A-like enzyme